MDFAVYHYHSTVLYGIKKGGILNLTLNQEQDSRREASAINLLIPACLLRKILPKGKSETNLDELSASVPSLSQYTSLTLFRSTPTNGF